MKEIYTFLNAIEDGITLTDEQQKQMLLLVGSGCRQETKARLARKLSLPLSLLEGAGIFSRVFLRYGREGIHYCAGQDYSAEIRVVRQCILR